MKKTHGFTLIEIVIAMAIVAIAIVSVVQSVGAYTKNTAYMRDKVFAQWVANNVMNEFFLAEEKPKKGSKTGVMEMAGKKWSWEINQEPAAQEGLFQIKVKVAQGEKKDRFLSVLTSFYSESIKYCPPPSTNANENSGVNNFGGQQSGC